MFLNRSEIKLELRKRLAQKTADAKLRNLYFRLISGNLNNKGIAI